MSILLHKLSRVSNGGACATIPILTTNLKIMVIDKPLRENSGLATRDYHVVGMVVSI